MIHDIKHYVKKDGNFYLVLSAEPEFKIDESKILNDEIDKNKIVSGQFFAYNRLIELWFDIPENYKKDDEFKITNGLEWKTWELFVSKFRTKQRYLHIFERKLKIIQSEYFGINSIRFVVGNENGEFEIITIPNSFTNYYISEALKIGVSE